ncbi:hypothetical protein KDK_00780 [Dictyobacter kobayashii]|uniref:Uncharacterized protein n=1 Tax=Dictyobacter kobayashii TaxID=2014872 RepID=A0A402AAZ7_9CHLR|nr:hypothetical protein KDK_00780 [Dictyobacter kobayashii]
MHGPQKRVAFSPEELKLYSTPFAQFMGSADISELDTIQFLPPHPVVHQTLADSQARAELFQLRNVDHIQAE